MSSQPRQDDGLPIVDERVIVRVMLTFKRAAEAHLGDCARRGFTPRSLTTYGRTYDEFEARLPVDFDVAKITLDDIRRYLGTKTHLSRNSISGCESHLASLFVALYMEGKIPRNPMDRLTRTKRVRPEDLDVVTVSTEEVRALLAAGITWSEKLAIAVPAYLGPRRAAIAAVTLDDYDRDRGRMRFKEKGRKVIWKPVPAPLADMIRAAENDGAYADYKYIIPPEGTLHRPDNRDARVIWRIITRVAARAGVKCHVHALRAAFAVFYDECYPGDVLALRDLMGHASVQTTEVYLRRRDKEAGMERVRGLSWDMGEERFERSQSETTGLQPVPALPLRRSPGHENDVADAGALDALVSSQSAGNTFASSPDGDSVVLQPPFAENPHEHRVVSQQDAERLDAALVDEARARLELVPEEAS